jgi:hypothetical protein
MSNKYLEKIAAISSLATWLGKGVIPNASKRVGQTTISALQNAKKVGEDIVLSKNKSMTSENKTLQSAIQANYKQQSKLTPTSQGFRKSRGYI